MAHSLLALFDRTHTTQVPFAVGTSMSHLHAQDVADMSDEALLEHALENPSAFEFLLMRYQTYFLDRATYVVKNRDEAEDIVQDTFVRIYRFAPHFKSSAGTFKSWATTILMNVARTHYQKKAKSWERTAPLTPEHYESLSAPSRKEAIEAKDIIERALEFVPEDTRKILQLAFIQELPYKEIAKIECTTEGAIKTRVHRAKRTLRSIIGSVE